MSDDLLSSSTVQIVTDDGRSVGVGFVVSSDGLIVTCAHVIVEAGSSAGGDVTIRFGVGGSAQRARVLSEGWCEPSSDDLAFLRVEGDLPKSVTGLKLGSSRGARGHRFSSLGFPELRNERNIIPFDSVLAEGYVFGIVKRPGGQEALQLRSSELDRGFSGAPVLDPTSTQVIGIVTDVKLPDPRKKQQNLAWATPSENIVRAFPQIPLERECTVSRKLRPYFAHVLYRAQHFTGREAHLEILREFWDKEGGGVLSLVGIGGAGKTAIVRHFVETRDWLDPKESSEYPDGLFVWSFYDAPDTTEFITESYFYFSQWLDRERVGQLMQDGRRANVFLLARALEAADCRFLIVLDGLEKMQSDGTAMNLERGKLVDPSLKNLLLRIADGVCGHTKAIVTSRFPLTDLSEWAGYRYSEVDVDRLEKEAARSLLRKLGVRGPNAALDLVAEEYGSHALTLDLLGRLLAEYYGGDPLKAKYLPPLETAAGSSIVDKQARKLARVLAAYERKLAPSELAVLECLSVFRRPVDSGLFREVLLGEEHTLAFHATADLTSQRLKSILHTLAARRLVIVEEDNGEERFTAHPAVRDHFYIRLTEPEKVHAAVRSRLATLVDAPGYIKPQDAKAISLIEELIYHTIKVGRSDEAYQIYKDRLGYLHLGWNLGDHVRGAGIARAFQLQGLEQPGDIQQYEWERLTIDYGLYLKNMGLLDESIEFFSRAAERERRQEISAKNAALALQNLSAVQVLRGVLPNAEDSAQKALEYAVRTSDNRLVQDCRVRLATALALQGRNEEAESVFQTVRSLLTKERKDDFPRDLPGIRLGWLLMRLGRLDEARVVLEETRELSKYFDFKIISARADVLIAELAFRVRNRQEAKLALDRVYSWASSAYDQEMVVAANLVSAWMALTDEDVPSAMHSLRDGLRVARECGHSIYWIDLKIAEGYANLALGNYSVAETCATQALSGQFQERGEVKLHGARAEECGYLWGEADALQLLGEILLRSNRSHEALDRLLEAREIRVSLADAKLQDTEILIRSLAHKDSRDR